MTRMRMIHASKWFTEELAERFSTAILSTQKTKKEEGFVIYIDKHDKLFPGETVYGNEGRVDLEFTWDSLPLSVDGYAIFHTHSYYAGAEPAISHSHSAMVESRRAYNQQLPPEFNEKYGNVLTMPSVQDFLTAIINYWDGNAFGGLVIASDIDSTHVDSWEIIKPISETTYLRASRMLNYWRNKVVGFRYTPWILRIFEREQFRLPLVELVPEEAMVIT